MEKKEFVGIEKEFVNNDGVKTTIQIESSDGYKINSLNNVKYKLANFKKNNNVDSLNNKNNIFTKDIGIKMKKNGIFTSDIGLKSSGFAQVASLSFIVALAGLFVMYLMFRY